MNKTDYSKPKNQGVKFDHLNINQCYAFTINPKKECRSTNIKGWYREQWNELRSLVKGCSMQLHLEASPLSKLHWHGYIKVHSILEFRAFLTDLANFGTYCIKDTDAFEKQNWEEYIQKQRHIWGIIIDGWKDPNLTYPLNIDPRTCSVTQLVTQAVVAVDIGI